MARLAKAAAASIEEKEEASTYVREATAECIFRKRCTFFAKKREAEREREREETAQILELARNKKTHGINVNGVFFAACSFVNTQHTF